ncbi:MAG: zinc metallopeptidase [Hydrogeniiclostridium sp.]
MGFYFFDYTYFLYMLPAIIISMVAQFKVNSAFKKYSQISTLRGVTGRESAGQVLRYGQVTGVEIQPTSGRLTDHFDPRSGIIRLSQPVYDVNSIAAVGVAAHEAGHAIQHARGYMPIKLRSALVPITNIGSNLSVPLILIGLMLPVEYDFVVTIGILLYSLMVVFQLVTLPVEFNASSRALKALDEAGILQEEELRGAKKVLSAAAMTYLAATFTALMSLLRLLAIVAARQGRNRN